MTIRSDPLGRLERFGADVAERVVDSDSLVPHLDPFRDCRRRLLVIYLHDSKDAAAELSISPRTIEATLSYRTSVLRLVLPVSLTNDAQINERILRHVGSKGA